MVDSLVASHPQIGPLLSDRPQRARLLEAMVRVVAEKGYDLATVSDAVRLARVSRGTFYELFESKEACLLAAYRAGNEVLEQRIRDAIREAEDWRDELRLGIRVYLRTLEQDQGFARVYLLEAQVLWAERPPDALYVLASGVHELACARVRAGEPVLDLEDTLVGCAVRLAAKEEPWI